MPSAVVVVIATSLLLLSGCGESESPATTAAVESHECDDSA